MDIYLTIDEKYLHAIEEYEYGRSPKSLQLLNEIIAAEPLYARAYYHLGLIYYRELKDYQQAGYCFKTCNELESQFPDVYVPYMKLLSFLNMERSLITIMEKALKTPGVDRAVIYTIMGTFSEQNRQLPQARSYFEQAYALSTSTDDIEEIEKGISRLEHKRSRSSTYRYSLS